MNTILPIVGAVAMVLTQQTDTNMYKLIAGERMATFSTSYKGTPFGSLTPFIMDKKGNPVLFLSDLAQHTENITKNPRCSIMVHRIDKSDIFNSPRITLAGKAVKVSDKERDEIKKIYLKRHPEAEDFIDFGDFNFYRIELDAIQYIGGFGDINWVDVADYRKDYPKK